MKVRINLLEKKKGARRHTHVGTVDVPCTVERVYGEDPTLHPRFVIVKLTEAGGGYPAGRELTVHQMEVVP